MEQIFKNKQFAEAYQRLDRVKLNPRRHTARNAREHSDEAAEVAAALAQANGCAEEQIRLMRRLGHAHDIGKVTGTSRPQASVDLLMRAGITEEPLLPLVKWHDVSLPWYRSASRGQRPSDRAWQRLAREVDLRLLCMFMVADRADAPPGWRRNAPTLWFLGEARRRGLISRQLVLDLEGRPSEISAGGAAVRRSPGGPEVLVIRARSTGYELPQGDIEWDEQAQGAAMRETREETGLLGPIELSGPLGELRYGVGNDDGGTHLKLVRYFRLAAATGTQLGPHPSRTRECRWISPSEVEELPLVNDELRPLLRRAVQEERQDVFFSE